MNKKIVAAIGVIALGCIIMLIWAWRSGDSALVIMMGVALVLICGVGILPVAFNAHGIAKPRASSQSTVVVKNDSVEHRSSQS